MEKELPKAPTDKPPAPTGAIITIKTPTGEWELEVSSTYPSREEPGAWTVFGWARRP